MSVMLGPEAQVETRLERIDNRQKLEDLPLPDLDLSDVEDSVELERAVWRPDLKSYENFLRLGSYVLSLESSFGVERPMPRFALPPQDAFLWYLYNAQCVYCDHQPLTARSAANGGKGSRTISPDHVLPVREGGLTVVNNMVAACKPCNAAKYTASPRAYLEELYLGRGKAWRNMVWQAKIQEKQESGYFG